MKSTQILVILLMLAMLALTSCSAASGGSVSESSTPLSEVSEASPPEISVETAPPQSSSDISSTAAPVPESITFNGRTFLVSEADDRITDTEANMDFVIYNDIGFIGLADGTEEPEFQYVEAGQVIGGATVDEGIRIGFDLIDGKWELTESDMIFTGPVEFVGELRKIPEGELEMLQPGTLTFTATESESGFMPYMYGFNVNGVAEQPMFILDGYDPETEFPELFSEADTVQIKVMLDSIRMWKTDRATASNHAILSSVALLES